MKHSGSLVFAITGFLLLSPPAGWALGVSRFDEDSVREAVERAFDEPDLRRYRVASDGDPASTQTSEADGSAPTASSRSRSGGATDWLSSLLLGGVSGFAYLLLGVAVAAFLVIIAFGVRAIFMRRSDREPRTVDVSAGEWVVADVDPASASERLERAEEHARSGRWREAIAELMAASRRSVEAAGFLANRRGSTARDYEHALRSRPEAAAAFRRVASSFHEVWFGRRTAEEPRWHDARRAYRDELVEHLVSGGGEST